MRAALPVLALGLLAGCVPSLKGWRVGAEGEDAGRPPSPDAGPSLLVPDCRAPIPLGAGYREGFEGGPGGWGVTTESGDVPASWGWGRPEGETITRAAEGDYAFATGLFERYQNREESLLVSPCFDASAAAHDLLVSARWATSTEASADRLSLEYSVDGGATWVVATGEPRIGWYGGSGWSGMHDWTEAATLLPGTAGQSRVQLRFRFHSDSSVIPGDGAAIDDVALRPASFDLGISVTEAARCGWMVATVTNVGGLPVTGFEIRGDVDGAPVTPQPFDREIGYLDTEVVEIGGPLAFYTAATVFTVGDENPDNDTAAWGHSTVPFGGGYFSDFEADDGGLILGGSPTSWEWGEPAGTLIRSAASGTRAWMTNPSGDYMSSERGYLTWPCFDMGALSRDPQISLARVYDTEACCDYGRVEVSIDGGDFVKLGNSSSGGTNWYAGSNGWQGSSGAGLWQVAQHPLTDTHGHGAVRVRIVFHSDGSGSGEGFGVDDLALIP
ncbi:MAG: hypothetical protein KC619_14775 [Myxococcales bacterium]|nr:hypothetical protein [Myxococcales bacterium]